MMVGRYWESTHYFFLSFFFFCLTASGILVQPAMEPELPSPWPQYWKETLTAGWPGKFQHTILVSIIWWKAGDKENGKFMDGNGPISTWTNQKWYKSLWSHAIILQRYAITNFENVDCQPPIKSTSLEE